MEKTIRVRRKKDGSLNKREKTILKFLCSAWHTGEQNIRNCRNKQRSL